MSSAVPMTNAVPMINPARIRERRLKRTIWLSRIGLLVVILAAWQGFGPLIGDLVASSPVEVTRALGEYATGQLGPDLLATMEEVVFGYVIGAVGGVIFGVVLASSRVIAGVLDPFIIGLYGIPKIAFGPVLVVWLGIALAPKVALAAVMVFFLVFFSAYQGIREVDEDRVNAVRRMGATPMEVRRYVVLPGARSSIFLGLKLGVPEALVGAIVGEFISSDRGVGHYIQFSTSQLDTAGVFAGLIVLTVLSLVLNALVNRFSKPKK
jgi:sulfonate transport system permease protein